MSGEIRPPDRARCGLPGLIRRIAPVESGAATFTATFELGEDGWWAAQVVEVPEAISQGRTLDEARTNIADALALALDLRVKEGRDIPSPGRVAVAPVTPAH